jgi:cytochrome b6-f complex iron-sulfur subunit
MSLVDDLRAGTPAQELDRREALGKLTSAALGIAGLGTMITTVRYLRPNVLFEPPTRVGVGRPEDIGVGTLLVLPEQKLFVVHTANGFVAMSAVCTHLGCMTRYLDAEQAIFCPCHGSRFDRLGQVTGGPAPTALDRFEVSLRNGELVVDMRRPVDSRFVLRA